jgi:AcrR family transcriptional regulator
MLWLVERRAYRSQAREARAALTRGRVLTAATAEFLERGFAGATMRGVATRAGVSVPTVELLFGTKGRLLKAAIDVAIAGDDAPVAMLDRQWARTAESTGSVAEFLRIVTGVIGPAQERSAGLVLAAFEAAATDEELAEVARQLSEQRAGTAGWIVEQLAAKTSPRPGRTWREAVDTVWVLMDPAVFDRLVRRRAWPVKRYQRWLADSLGRLLTDDT